MSATDDDISLGFVHLSSAELTKAIFYAKIAAERMLNINKTERKKKEKKRKEESFNVRNLIMP